jgi:hypothetical protein
MFSARTVTQILDYLKHDEVIAVCTQFPETQGLCQDPEFWRHRVNRKFDLDTKPDDLTWRQLDSLLDNNAILPVPVAIQYPDGYEQSLGNIWVYREDSVNSILQRLHDLTERPMNVLVESDEGQESPIAWNLEPSDIPIGDLRINHDYLWDTNFNLILTIPLIGDSDGISSLSSLSSLANVPSSLSLSSLSSLPSLSSLSSLPSLSSLSSLTSKIPTGASLNSAQNTLGEAQNVLNQLHQLGVTAQPLFSSLASGFKTLGSGLHAFLPGKKSAAVSSRIPVPPSQPES